jgi:hypothetical protein
MESDDRKFVLNKKFSRHKEDQKRTEIPAEYFIALKDEFDYEVEYG